MKNVRKWYLVPALLIACALCAQPARADVVIWPVFAGAFVLFALLCVGVAVLVIVLLVRAVRRVRRRRLEKREEKEARKHEDPWEN